jgi:hypothetical protein
MRGEQGGAISYAAAVLSAFGIRACIVTGDPHWFPWFIYNCVQTWAACVLGNVKAVNGQ